MLIPEGQMRRACLQHIGAIAVVATSIAASGCGVISRQAVKVKEYAQHTGGIGRYGSLTKKESEWAKIAWRYFENNTNPQNGLINGSDRTPTFSMWHMGDYLAALTAARELELIEAREFDERVSRVLAFLSTMDMSEASVPNKVYNTLSGKMVNFANAPADIGWSAVETGRLLAWLKILGNRYPVYREYADKIVFRMNFCQVIDHCGNLFGLSKENNGRFRYAEGRLGYEQLAAAGFAAWGFDTRRIWHEPKMETVNIYGMPVQYDARESRLSGVQTPVLTTPYVLMGMEFGWKYPGSSTVPTGAPDFHDLADAVYKVQETRYVKEGVLTARTDYPSREAPFLVYDAVFAAGYPWNTVGPNGKEFAKLAIVSTRAAFGMWALWPTPYTDQLILAVQTLYSPERGWYDGRFEATGAPKDTISLSTNAQILEALLFKEEGSLMPAPIPGRFLEVQTSNVLDRPNRCFPTERPICDAKTLRPERI